MKIIQNKWRQELLKLLFRRKHFLSHSLPITLEINLCPKIPRGGARGLCPPVYALADLHFVLRKENTLSCWLLVKWNFSKLIKKWEEIYHSLGIKWIKILHMLQIINLFHFQYTIFPFKFLYSPNKEKWRELKNLSNNGKHVPQTVNTIKINFRLRTTPVSPPLTILETHQTVTCEV